MEGFGFILASASPRRKELLARILGEFEVIPSNVRETMLSNISPIDQAVNNSLRKAREVAGRFPDAIVIAADTVVVLDDMAIGKPKDLCDAVKMLESLSGRTHQVVTGVAVVCCDREMTDFDFSDVTFRKLTKGQIEVYVHEKMPLDKAGAYGIQEIGDEFVEFMEGSYENVMGLPLGVAYRLLDEMLFKEWGNRLHEL